MVVNFRVPALLAASAVVVLGVAGCTAGAGHPMATYPSPTAAATSLGATLTSSTVSDTLPTAEALPGDSWHVISDKEGASQLLATIGAATFEPAACDVRGVLTPSTGSAQPVAHAGISFSRFVGGPPQYASADVYSYADKVTDATLADVKKMVAECGTITATAAGQTIDVSLKTTTPVTKYGDETVEVHADFYPEWAKTPGGVPAELLSVVDTEIVRIGHTVVVVTYVGLGNAQTGVAENLTAATMAGLQQVTGR